MALTNEAERIATALGETAGIALVTRGWPASFAALPCVAVLLAGETPADYRDDAEYLTELEYYVHLFCATMSECDSFGAAVQTTMEHLGYTRTYAYEDTAADACHLVRRYRRSA